MKKQLLATLLLALSATMSACGGIQSESKNKKETNLAETACVTEQPTEAPEQKKCTVDDVSFLVNEEWEEMEECEGAFYTPDKKVVYQLQGISPLGSRTPKEFYEYLIEDYAKSYEIQERDEEPVSFVTADKLEASIGRIEMTADKVLYSIDVLMVPQKNIVVTFAAQCREEDSISTDIREVSSTATFAIATKDYISGNTFIGGDGSELCLAKDGSFMYYQSEDDHDSYYYKGNYEVFYGQDAIDKVTSMTEYGVTEDELERTITANMQGYEVGGSSAYDFLLEEEAEVSKEKSYQVCKDTFYAVILHNETLVEDAGQETEISIDTLYMGHYILELKLADMVNANTGNRAEWTLKGKTK